MVTQKEKSSVSDGDHTKELTEQTQWLISALKYSRKKERTGKGKEIKTSEC